MNLGNQLSYTVGVEMLAGAANPGNFRDTWSTVENFTGTGFASSGTPNVSDLYQNAPGNPLTTSGNYLGDFTLGNDGSMTFTPSAVPEPGTLAMMGCGLLTLAAVRRLKHGTKAE